MTETSVSIQGVQKYWPDSKVHACHNLTLALNTGEIHALVGENGAGKSTLGHIIAGIQIPDEGRLIEKDRCLNLATRQPQLLDHMALIRQQKIWPPTLKIWEVMALGRPKSFKVYGAKHYTKLFEETAKSWDLTGVSPKNLVARLSARNLQQAELIIALSFSPTILIIDEPILSLEGSGGKNFFSLLQSIKERGYGILLISHRLPDIFSIADTITVMRKGRVMGTWKTAETNQEKITASMFGSIAVKKSKKPRPSSKAKVPQIRGEPRLFLDKIRVEKQGKILLKDIQISLYAAEILAITGLQDSGLSVLEDLISGNCRPSSGIFLVEGKPIKGAAVGMRKAGLAYVPSDKFGRGTSLKSSIAENMLLLEARHLSRWGWLSPRQAYRWSKEQQVLAEIKAEPEQRLEELSGGNIHKVILQRELHRHPRLLTIAEPTWGLDDYSRKKLRDSLRQACLQGTAILLLSSDLDEGLEMADRCAVLYEGRLSPIRPTGDWNRSDLVRLMMGNRKEKK